ncbi:hypothetical protein TraAM80_09017, partial [Trypanosoma rangeli]
AGHRRGVVAVRRQQVRWWRCRGRVMTKSWVGVFVARGNRQIAHTGLNLLTFPRRLRATVVTASASLPNRRTWAAVVDRAAGGPVPRGHAAFTAPCAMQGSALRRKWQGVEEPLFLLFHTVLLWVTCTLAFWAFASCGPTIEGQRKLA